MAYSPITSDTTALFSVAWFESGNLLSVLNNALGNSFQVQINRTDLARLINGAMVSIVGVNTQFPATGFYIYRFDDQVKVAINNILGATDTKNRLAEVNDGSAPSSQVELNSMRRTDDATVSIRAAILSMIDLILQSVGTYDRNKFNNSFGLTWTEPVTGTSVPATSAPTVSS